MIDRRFPQDVDIRDVFENVLARRGSHTKSKEAEQSSQSEDDNDSSVQRVALIQLLPETVSSSSNADSQV